MCPSDGNPTTLRRDPSIEFWVDRDSIANGSSRHRVTASPRSNADLKGEDLPEDPPFALINKFLHRQRASRDFSVDIDFEITEEIPQSTPLTPLVESPIKADLGEDRVSLLRLVLAREASVRRRRGDLRNGGSAMMMLVRGCWVSVARRLGGARQRIVPEKQSVKAPAVSGQFFWGILGKGVQGRWFLNEGKIVCRRLEMAMEA